MLDDNLELFDVENAILKGRIDKRLTRDKRGTRYQIEGPERGCLPLRQFNRPANNRESV